MSNDQAEQIKSQIDRVYKDLFADAQAREKRHNEIHQEMLEKIEAVSIDLKPIKEVFTNGSGFVSTMIVILKSLGLLGVGVGVIYGFIKFLKA